LFAIQVQASTVIATVNSSPITDSDITARVKLMAKQGNTPTDNRRQALQHIINDYVKLNYASNFGVTPTDEDANKELKQMKDMDDLDSITLSMARFAMRADIAWQVIVQKTILPTIDLSASELKAAKIELAREKGLPVELTIVRLTDIDKNTAKKLKKPDTCEDAISMAVDLGGYPQKFTALQYELADDIRKRVADLPTLTWSPVVDKSVLLICSAEKTSEYGDLDNIIKQNAIYKQAMFMSDQQLKQLRRKAVIIINDDKYKL